MKAFLYANIFKYQLKVTAGLNLAAAFLLILLTPVIFSLQLVSQEEIAQTGELYLSIIGIILLTPLGSIEERYFAGELVRCRRVSYSTQLFLRVLLMSILIVLLQSMIFVAARLQEGSFDLCRTILGIWITSMLLGMVGFTVSHFSHDVKSGYLAAFAYYMLEYFTRGKYTASFYLFSMLKGSFMEKYYLLGLIAALFVLNGMLLRKRD